MNTTIPQDAPQKQCKKCEKPFPATSPYFRPAKENRDGLENTCHICRNKAARNNYASHKTNTEDVPEELVCSKCGKSKRFIAFRKSPTHRYGRHSQCNQCRKETREIYRANPEVKARALETDKAWRRAHPEQASQIWQRWAKTDNGLSHCRLRVRTRKARKNSSQGTHTVDDIQAQYKRQKGKCYYCHTKVGKNYHVDHVIPISRGGSNDISNLVITCTFCNLSKKDKLPHEWPAGGHLL